MIIGPKDESRTVENWFRHCPNCQTSTTQLGSIPFRCDSCGFTVFFGPVSAVGGLIVHDDRLLMVRRARDPGKDQWGLPGGFVDQGESLEVALAREVFEETRLTLESTQFLMSGPNQYNYRGVIGSVVDVFFVCSPVDPDAIVLAKDELSHFEWVADPAQKMSEMAFESNAIAVQKWFDEFRH